MADNHADLPHGWNWDLGLTPHLLNRMTDRNFNEADLRAMLQTAVGYESAVTRGRHLIDCRHFDQSWTVVVEPDEQTRQRVVVTA